MIQLNFHHAYAELFVQDILFPLMVSNLYELISSLHRAGIFHDLHPFMYVKKFKREEAAGHDEKLR